MSDEKVLTYKDLEEKKKEISRNLRQMNLQVASSGWIGLCLLAVAAIVALLCPLYAISGYGFPIPESSVASTLSGVVGVVMRKVIRPSVEKYRDLIFELEGKLSEMCAIFDSDAVRRLQYYNFASLESRAKLIEDSSARAYAQIRVFAARPLIGQPEYDKGMRKLSADLVKMVSVSRVSKGLTADGRDPEKGGD